MSAALQAARLRHPNRHEKLDRARVLLCCAVPTCFCVDDLNATAGSSSRKYLSHCSATSRGTKSAAGNGVGWQERGWVAGHGVGAAVRGGRMFA